jgi:hypothetical protein
MKPIVILVLVILVTSCHREHFKPACGTSATVVDLSSNGCAQIGFKLSDGMLLTPAHSFCGTGHDPLSNFELVPGQEVMIGYEIIKGSPCASITAAKITCITLTEPDEK